MSTDAGRPDAVGAGLGSVDWWRRSGIRGDAEPPEWANLLYAALRVTSPAATGPVEIPLTLAKGDRSALSGLLPIVAPLVRVSGDSLADALLRPGANLDVAGVRASFERWLARRLVQIAARTLVLELNVARVTAALPGATPTDRFESFVARTSTAGGLTELMTEYPVLARLLGQACWYAVGALVQLCQRLGDDRSEIVAVLLAGDDPGVVRTVELGAGDGHQLGRAVAVVCFADGARVVYKPRPVAVHRHFNEVVAWFNGTSRGPQLRTIKLIDRLDYGWAEFVPWRPCSRQDEVDRFYYRQGSLVAVLHALAGTDIHAENLIAHGEDPVLIDGETLFHPALSGSGGRDDDDPAARVWESSVHRTGVLPMRLLGDDAAVDVSGLGGDRGAISPVEAVAWEAAGTDEMRLVRRPVLTRGSQNRPILAGAAVEPATFADQLLAGFRDSYEAIVAARTDLLGSAGLLARFADDDVRVVVRPTQLYATLLDESTHPDVLRDAQRRNALLDELRSDPDDAYRARLVDDEIADLWAGDVPYFRSRPASVNLWSSRGRRIDGVLGEPMLDRVSASISALGEQDRRWQEWVIQAALASRVVGDAHAVDQSVGPDDGQMRCRAVASGSRMSTRDHLIAAAEEVAEVLASTACRGDTRTNWLGLELAGDRFWHVAPLGAALGNGHSGPALFLAQLARFTGAARYRDLARRAVAGLPVLLERLAGHPELGAVGSGGFAGLGGIAYTLVHLAAWLDDTEIGEWVQPAARLTTTAAAAEVEAGVVGGTAGGLASLVAVYEDTGLPAALSGARACADRLLARPVPAEPGFAAGAAGLGWALLRFAAAAGGDARCEQGGLAALRTAWATMPPSRSWCRGLTGLALATVDARAHVLDHELADRLAEAVRVVADGGALANHSLCHGELGRLAVLQAVGDGVRPVAQLAQALPRIGPRCGTPNHVPSPGLLTGLAGIGHGLLRLAFPSEIPSLLMLHAVGRTA